MFHRPTGPAQWAKAKLIRYADDFVILARYIGRGLVDYTETKLERWLGLTLNRDKTCTIDLREPGVSFDFLGYTFRYEKDLHGGSHRYMNMMVSKAALKRERARIKEMTGPEHCFKPVRTVIEDLNRQLRGWKNYFNQGYPRKGFREVNRYLQLRLNRHLNRRSQRGYRKPKERSFYQHVKELGLEFL